MATATAIERDDRRRIDALQTTCIAEFRKMAAEEPHLEE
jgi:hypothetical protein